MNLKNKKWSYSSVSMFESCPLSFKLRYVDEIPERPNAMAQCGKLAHSILERYFKGELMAFELADVFEEEFDSAVTEHFPFFNMYHAFYDQTLEYFRNFDGIDDEYEVVAVEQELSGIISRDLADYSSKGYRFVGYADLLLRDETGLVLVDHKSHSKWRSKSERAEYFRQQYVYAYFIKQMYGEMPYKLVFNKFRTGEWDEELFHAGDYTAALDWFVRGIETILSQEDWECVIDKFRCDCLCGYEECVWNGRSQ